MSGDIFDSLLVLEFFFSIKSMLVKQYIFIEILNKIRMKFSFKSCNLIYEAKIWGVTC